MFKKVLLVILILFCLTRCFDYKEINDYAVVSAISIDEGKVKKYNVGIQIMNAKKDEESDTSSIAFYKAEGNTIYEGLEKILLDLPKELYLGHNEVVILGENLLKKESALNFLDYFLRDSEIEKDSLVVVAKDDEADSILKIITPLETIPSRNLKETIRISDNFGDKLSTITLDKFIASLSNNGEEPVLPSVKVQGSIKKGEKNENISQSNPSAKITLDKMAYFEKGKLKGYLTKEEEQGYKILSNTANGTYINVLCDNKNYATIRIKSNNTKEELSFRDQLPIIKFNTKITGRLVEYNCKADFLKSNKYIKRLERCANKRVNKLTKKVIKKLYKDNSSDALKIGEMFYSKKSRYLKKYNIKESDVKNIVKFKTNPKVTIDRIGLSIKSVKEVSIHE